VAGGFIVPTDVNTLDLILGILRKLAAISVDGYSQFWVIRAGDFGHNPHSLNVATFVQYCCAPVITEEYRAREVRRGCKLVGCHTYIQHTTDDLPVSSEGRRSSYKTDRVSSLASKKRLGP